MIVNFSFIHLSFLFLGVNYLGIHTEEGKHRCTVFTYFLTGIFKHGCVKGSRTFKDVPGCREVPLGPSTHQSTTMFYYIYRGYTAKYTVLGECDSSVLDQNCHDVSEGSATRSLYRRVTRIVLYVWISTFI